MQKIVLLKTRLSEAKQLSQANLVISEIKMKLATKKYCLSQMHLTQRKI
jgi:hypothetical protein